jgi:hypothetical protein
LGDADVKIIHRVGDVGIVDMVLLFFLLLLFGSSGGGGDDDDNGCESNEDNKEEDGWEDWIFVLEDVTVGRWM